MQYFANQEAVREPVSELTLDRDKYKRTGYQKENYNVFINHLNPAGGERKDCSSGRNPRSVLSVSSEPLKMAHYAAFPKGLVAPLIRATCPARCCTVCCAPYAPIVERKSAPSEVMAKRNAPTDGLVHSGTRTGGVMYGMGANLQKWREENPPQVIGYRPSCTCGTSGWEPGTVLDPFVGSGTVLAVARELGLNGIGLDLSHSYLDEQAKIRGAVGTPSNALDGLPMFEGLMSQKGNKGEK